jgi:hypothetical protein
MKELGIDDVVRLTKDIPERQLVRGETGVICSTWFAPEVTFEVEFHQIGHDCQTRCLVHREQVELDERATLVG